MKVFVLSTAQLMGVTVQEVKYMTILITYPIFQREKNSMQVSFRKFVGLGYLCCLKCEL